MQDKRIDIEQKVVIEINHRSNEIEGNVDLLNCAITLSKITQPELLDIAAMLSKKDIPLTNTLHDLSGLRASLLGLS